MCQNNQSHSHPSSLLPIVPRTAENQLLIKNLNKMIIKIILVQMKQNDITKKSKYFMKFEEVFK